MPPLYYSKNLVDHGIMDATHGNCSMRGVSATQKQSVRRMKFKAKKANTMNALNATNMANALLQES